MSGPRLAVEPGQARARATRERLLDAALALFSERGFHATTTAGIAARAGVATGSFYRYFTDKKAIFLATLERMEERMAGAVFALADDLRARDLDPARVVGELVAFSIAIHRENRALHREVLVMAARDPDVTAAVAAREARVRARLLDFLRGLAPRLAVDDIEVASELVFLVVEEVAHRAVINPSPLGEARLVEGALTLLTRYLVAPVRPGADPPPAARPRAQR